MSMAEWLLRLPYGSNGSVPGCLSAGIEPLLGEGEGRFVWTVDTPEAANPEKFLNLASSVEPSLQSAMSAASEVFVALDPVVV